MFGIEQINHRYSTPSSLRGSKLLLQSLSRTMKFKLKKINQIKSARSQLELYITRGDDEAENSEKKLYRTSKILRGRPASYREMDFEHNQLMVKPADKAPEIKKQKPRPRFRSSNIGEKMNFYLNNLVNRGRDQENERQEEIKPKKVDEMESARLTYNQSHNTFWKKMKRSLSTRRESSARQYDSEKPYILKLDLRGCQK